MAAIPGWPCMTCWLMSRRNACLLLRTYWPDECGSSCKDLPLGHFENFAADPDRILSEENADFVVELAGSGQVLNVPSDRTILDVLIENGIEVPHMCAEGLCGTCLVDVVEGVPEHRDFVLDDDEKAAGDTIAVCCSRAKSERLKLDI